MTMTLRPGRWRSRLILPNHRAAAASSLAWRRPPGRSPTGQSQESEPKESPKAWQTPLREIPTPDVRHWKDSKKQSLMRVTRALHDHFSRAQADKESIRGWMLTVNWIQHSRL